MNAIQYVFKCICAGLLIISQAKAQQPDSVHMQIADSATMQQFLVDTGPAEAVFSFVSPPPYRFKSGVYVIGNPAFPLLNSPDSLVQQPVERAHKQRRIMRISALATTVPLAILAYSATRIVLSLGSVVAGRPSSSGLPDGSVIKAAGIATLTGVTVTATFNLASIINLQKGIKRHNRLFGRKMPTLFNPKGL